MLKFQDLARKAIADAGFHVHSDRDVLSGHLREFIHKKVKKVHFTRDQG